MNLSLPWESRHPSTIRAQAHSQQLRVWLPVAYERALQRGPLSIACRNWGRTRRQPALPRHIECNACAVLPAVRDWVADIIGPFARYTEGLRGARFASGISSRGLP